MRSSVPYPIWGLAVHISSKINVIHFEKELQRRGLNNKCPKIEPCRTTNKFFYHKLKVEFTLDICVRNYIFLLSTAIFRFF